MSVSRHRYHAERSISVMFARLRVRARVHATHKIDLHSRWTTHVVADTTFIVAEITYVVAETTLVVAETTNVVAAVQYNTEPSSITLNWESHFLQRIWTKK